MACRPGWRPAGGSGDRRRWDGHGDSGTRWGRGPLRVVGGPPGRITQHGLSDAGGRQPAAGLPPAVGASPGVGMPVPRWASVRSAAVCRRIAAVGRSSPPALMGARGSRCAAGGGAPATGSPAARRSAAAAGFRRRAYLPVGIRPGSTCTQSGRLLLRRDPFRTAGAAGHGESSARCRSAAGRPRGWGAPAWLACAVVDAIACWFAAGQWPTVWCSGLAASRRSADVSRGSGGMVYTVDGPPTRRAGRRRQCPRAGGRPAHSRWLIRRSRIGGQRGGAESTLEHARDAALVQAAGTGGRLPFTPPLIDPAFRQIN